MNEETAPVLDEHPIELLQYLEAGSAELTAREEAIALGQLVTYDVLHAQELVEQRRAAWMKVREQAGVPTWSRFGEFRGEKDPKEFDDLLRLLIMLCDRLVGRVGEPVDVQTAAQNYVTTGGANLLANEYLAAAKTWFPSLTVVGRLHSAFCYSLQAVLRVVWLEASQEKEMSSN